MAIFKVFCSLILFGCVLAQKGGLYNIEPCVFGDRVCWGKFTKNFLEQTSVRIPDSDFRPIDPVIIPSLEYSITELGLKFDFKNINVTGLKNTQIELFNMDNKQNIFLQLKTDGLKIDADVTIEFANPAKKVSGTYTATANTLQTAQYSFRLREDNGAIHLVIGPERITVYEAYNVTTHLGDNLGETLMNDADTRDICVKYADPNALYQKNTVGHIVAVAFSDIIHNIRTVCNYYSRSELFKNL